MAKLSGGKVVVIGGASGADFAVAAEAIAAKAEVVGSSQPLRVQAASEARARTGARSWM